MLAGKLSCHFRLKDFLCKLSSIPFTVHSVGSIKRGDSRWANCFMYFFFGCLERSLLDPCCEHNTEVQRAPEHHLTSFKSQGTSIYWSLHLLNKASSANAPDCDHSSVKGNSRSVVIMAKVWTSLTKFWYQTGISHKNQYRLKKNS